MNTLAGLHPISTPQIDTLIIDALTRYIAQSGIQPGCRLPPERVLAEKLGVSRNTVREALKRWEALGIILCKKGSGTFLKVDVGINDSFLSLCASKTTQPTCFMRLRYGALSSQDPACWQLNEPPQKI
ncbi:FadR/GntR family transcriptional regulator [Klebsiella variicola]|uniref:FadR/GntR family transcriptional regulator n=1 Tax=Klebsiella variicola TaxID=244366 RepID=UPI002B05E6B4|nr:GntR family transcriptional regulator [Klebsiella variicola]